MDDLITLLSQVDSVINPAGSPGSILASNHNPLLKSVINAVGNLSGFIYSSVDSGNATQGTFVWNGNAMNNTGAFNIIFSQLAIDGQDIGAVLNKMSAGDIIKYKDFKGRVALLLFNSVTAGQDGGGNDIYTVNVNGFSTNSNYTYTSGDNIKSVIDFFTTGGVSVFDQTNVQIHKDPSNANPTNTPEKNDLVTVRISQTLVITGIYKGDSLPLNDVSSYEVLDETELPIVP